MIEIGVPLGLWELAALVAIMLIGRFRYDRSVFVGLVMGIPLVLIGHVLYFAYPVLKQHRAFVNAIHELHDVPPTVLRTEVKKLVSSGKYEYIMGIKNSTAVKAGADGLEVKIEYEVRVPVSTWIDCSLSFRQSIKPGKRI